jgi:hypothetical protein
MKTWAIAIAALLSASLDTAAQEPAYGCDTAESKQLDFWLGEWELSHVADGKPVKSYNRITKILDGCAILEEFTGAPGTKLNGRSVSTFNRATGQWKQTWVDNTAAYLDFSGGIIDERMHFWRKYQRGGKDLWQRMVFEDVKRDSLKWLWQSSSDGGTTWKTDWEIDYKRLK